MKRFAGILGTVISIVSLSFAQVTVTGQKGLVRCFSAQTLDAGKLAINIIGEYSGEKTYVVRPIDPDVSLVTTNLGLSFGITNFLDLSFSVPIYFDVLNGVYADDDLTPFNEIKDGGPGDVAFGLKFQYPPYEHSHLFDMAYLGYLTLPTGAQEKGIFPRGAYYIPKDYDADDFAKISLYSAEKPQIDLKMLWTVDFGEIAWEGQDKTQIQFHINFGARFNTNRELEHAFLLNSGLEYTPIEFLTVFGEFTGETRLSKFTKGFDIGDDPLRITPGISLNTPVGMAIKLAIENSLSRKSVHTTWGQRNQEYTTRVMPGWNVLGGLQWAGFLIPKDKDQDGLKDAQDRCPEEPEDLDGFEDSDGCPETDNDKDAIPDAKDRCPNQPEDVDGVEDTDGCPDPDNDKDGIPDARDRCPSQAEDLDGFEDSDGCADIDNDRDGVPDSTDKCPNDAEDKDKFEDSDGCPDMDNDKDGIPDAKDKCPDKAENINGLQDEDGCPDTKKKVKPIKKRVTLHGVSFKTGSAELTFEAYSILDGIVAQLKGSPKVRVEIRGYTDNVGRRSSNIRLSQRRAESVKRYLVQRGIAGSRLVAIGFGPDNPIASNRTARGRSQNRRIELYRLN